MRYSNTRRLLACASVSVLFAAPVAAPVAAFAAGAHTGGHDAMMSGQPGKASAVTRTVEVTLHDNYYDPETISAKAGETVRFRVRNAGRFVHEFNIGTAAMHAAHQDEMAMMVEHGVLAPDHIDHAAAKAMQASMGHGMHEDANSVLLDPGASGEVVWTFPADAEVAIEFACNVPGHYDSGMVGDIELQR